MGSFVAELRKAGLPVSLAEGIDAHGAISAIGLGDRETLRHALAASLVKAASHRAAFDTVFDVFFALRRGEEGDGHDAESGHAPGEDTEEAGRGRGAGSGRRRGEGGGGGTAVSPEELAEMLFRALLEGDADAMRSAASLAVTMYAGMEPGRPVGGTYYLYRTLRNLDLDTLLARLVEAARRRQVALSPEQAGDGAGGADPSCAAPGDPLARRIAEDEQLARIDALRTEIEAEIRRRLVADRGMEAMARTLRKPLPEDVDVMHATREELAALRRALHPLARKLASRLARRRRHGRKGGLDWRATMRASLASGGVPVEPKFRKPHPAKPDIMVLADVSGSVASFARFTLQLVHTLSGQFSKVRSFVFVDGIDEVTGLFESSEDVADAVHRVNTEANVVWVDGHSDYGHAFVEFAERWGAGVGPRTSVLVLGDARNNYHASQDWVLADVAAKAKHVYWLNPEPRAYWGSGDSIIAEYAAHCDGVYECRTLRQLEAFVGSLV